MNVTGSQRNFSGDGYLDRLPLIGYEPNRMHWRMFGHDRHLSKCEKSSQKDAAHTVD